MLTTSLKFYFNSDKLKNIATKRNSVPSFNITIAFGSAFSFKITKNKFIFLGLPPKYKLRWIHLCFDDN